MMAKDGRRARNFRSASKHGVAASQHGEVSGRADLHVMANSGLLTAFLLRDSDLRNM